MRKCEERVRGGGESEGEVGGVRGRWEGEAEVRGE